MLPLCVVVGTTVTVSDVPRYLNARAVGVDGGCCAAGQGTGRRPPDVNRGDGPRAAGTFISVCGRRRAGTKGQDSRPSDTRAGFRCSLSVDPSDKRTPDRRRFEVHERTSLARHSRQKHLYAPGEALALGSEVWRGGRLVSPEKIPAAGHHQRPIAV